MMKFLKAQASSLIATGLDFLAVILLSTQAGTWYVGANMAGTFTGGAANFMINRQWVFNKEKGAIGGQALRYGITWVGNMLLNAAGVWLILHFTGWYSLIERVAMVKMIVSLLIGFTYSYIMQKRFVFKDVR
ncbi:GtrA family protein [Chitinophaga sp. CF418]|uniref:GtrA family protein n=1 Tax=Chitinophaga sp. CF418 TaxID=1855287 RepID=UPI000914F8B8|nr:GtrA family protein [Chitinophaga sp. CF418]SHM78036.1 Putative flippase GtrA (transmembrane translocase of bactoprenol-linked glucose) [Chitinophaga sp. CF418]